MKWEKGDSGPQWQDMLHAAPESCRRGWRRVDSASDRPGLAVARGTGFPDGFEAATVRSVRLWLSLFAL